VLPSQETLCFLVTALSLPARLDAPARERPSAPAAAFPAELDRYIANVLKQRQIPGIAIAVVRNDSILVAKGYGVRRLGSPDPVDENTVFDIASLTASFTATAAAILVDRGVLKWDEPVKQYLPDLVLPTDMLTRQATVRDFLSHRTGIEPANAMWMLTALDRREVLRRMRYLRSLVPLRRTMVYSNIGYTLVGEAAANAARTTFENLLRDLLIVPLEMSSTSEAFEQGAERRNVAARHITVAGRQEAIPRNLQRRVIGPAVAVQSSVLDLTRWMRLHLNSGVLDGKRFVSDSTMRAMHSIQVINPTTPSMRAARLVQDTVIGYGMGWQIADYRGHRAWWHAGNADGQLAYMALFPDDRLGITLLINTGSAPQIDLALLNRIADTYLGYEPRDWAAEAFARLPAMDSARNANERALTAMRVSASPSASVAAYAGRYEHPVFGPVWVRLAGSGLTLQMGEGQVADLEYHGLDAFYAVWRDPFFRENYGTHVAFTRGGDSVVALTMAMNGFTARKTGERGERAVASSNPARPDLTGVEQILGKWNLRVVASPDISSSWLEVDRSGSAAIVGRFVGFIGGARPIANIEWSQGIARFTIPTEWEWPSGDIRFEVRPTGDSLVGTMVRSSDGTMRAFVGKRSPTLRYVMPLAWTPPVPLFNGKDLSGWTVAPTARSLPNYWTVRDGVLVNADNEGANLMTVQRFQDFKVHAEFRLPERGTSGLFPRGRYWVILGTRAQPDPFHGTTGAVHKFLIPNENAGLGPNVWQAVDITLVGRRITVVINGKAVIVDQLIPGPTGSAIDIDEAAPGPIMIQGEETRVEFRNITISVPSGEATPAARSSGAIGRMGVGASPGTSVRPSLGGEARNVDRRCEMDDYSPESCRRANTRWTIGSKKLSGNAS